MYICTVIIEKQTKLLEMTNQQLDLSEIKAEKFNAITCTTSNTIRIFGEYHFPNSVENFNKIFAIGEFAAVDGWNFQMKGIIEKISHKIVTLRLPNGKTKRIKIATFVASNWQEDAVANAR